VLLPFINNLPGEAPDRLLFYPVIWVTKEITSEQRICKS
jgi:hypothetical protein